MGSISNGAGHHSPLSSAQSISSTSHTPSLPSYTSIAIWSRRPGDPSKAPGIIISPRAQPPEDIMLKALDLPTPPASPPKPPPVALPDDYAQERKEYKTDTNETMLVNSTISSSAVTEATDISTLPGSPMSTNTSVSGVDGPLTKEQIACVPVVAAAKEGTILGDVATSQASEPSSIATPEPAAAVIKTPPAKPSTPKLWASLFSSPSTSSTGTAASSLSPRIGLPTSSVVGFSIPASATNPSTSPVVPVIPAKKSELLNLLTNGPGGGGMDKIRTRGLINSGNMCFANAVLQVLVYCAPFQRLFMELGKMLVSQEQQKTSTPSTSAPPPMASSSSSGVTVIPNSARSQMNGTATPKPAKTQTPFIDATVQFLKEFIVEEEGESSNFGKKAKKNKDGFTNHVNGRSGGKGKEREIAKVDDVDGNGDGTDGDDWPESFLPSYVYEAMKEKKRFESMRGGQQEDAEEFLGFYLDTLEEELLSIQNSLAPPKKQQQEPPVEEKEEPEPPEEDGWLEVGKKNRMIITRTIKAVESPITRMFGGKFKSTLKAPGQKDSVLVEDWRSLRLDIQPESIHTIQDALAPITHPQSIQMTHPSRPGITIDANQKVLIEALPPVLVLHVKRFWYDVSVGGVVKVMKQVRFEPELEIGSDMVVPGKRPTKYRLFGAIYHHGHSASGGHYTLDVLHQNRYPGAKLREGWIRIDDELVSDVRSEDVFDAWEKDETRNAYLLFYRRIRS